MGYASTIIVMWSGSMVYVGRLTRIDRAIHTTGSQRKTVTMSLMVLRFLRKFAGWFMRRYRRYQHE